MKVPIQPGSTLGVMGGGQLGRMFVHAAQSLGYFTAVLDPDPVSPAGRVAHYHIATAYLDEAGLAQLMQRSHAITTEFENVPAPALRTLGAHRPVAPSAALRPWPRPGPPSHFMQCGVPCALHAVLDSDSDVERVPASLLPGILKTARLGYDGKGQVNVPDRQALQAAWNVLGRVPCILEQRLALHREVSVIIARDALGHSVSLPVQQNLHRDGILAVTQVPAPDLDPALADQALDAARRIAEAMRYVGVLCVEFFVLADGRLVANEMAPRPHNSGHYSIDACDVSQFELQVRTLAGLPLVQPRLHSAAVMINLLGDLWFDGAGHQREPDWSAVLRLPGSHLHLYGKADPRRGRKMGHLTVTAADAAHARAVAIEAAAVLGLPAF